jgi:hypothetical protein
MLYSFMRAGRRAFVPRLLWVVSLGIMITGLSWLDYNRGGIVAPFIGCAVLTSRSNVADTLIFGSSRTGTAYDAFYMQTIFAHTNGLKKKTVQRLALTDRDTISAYFFLRNAIKNGTPPSVVVLELMFQKAGEQADKAEFLRKRRANILRIDELPVLREVFHSNAKPWDLEAIVSPYVDRYTALIEGFRREPGGKKWQLSRCEGIKDWARGGRWVAGEHEASAGVNKEVKRTRKALQSREHLVLKKPKKWRKMAPKTITVTNLGLDAPTRAWEIDAIRNFIELAESAGAKVILTNLQGYNLHLSDVDRRDIERLFPTATLFDATEGPDSILHSYWRDPAHMGKAGSKLTSALLVQKIRAVYKQ